MLHLEHVTYTPAPSGPKREGTEPSVQTWKSDWEREDSLLEADWSRAVLLPVQSGMKEGNGEVGCSPWGKRGRMIRVSHGMGETERPKSRMISRRVSSLVDRARFLLPGHKG